MTIELVAIIITGVVSAFDLVVNIATACSTGRFKVNCCDVVRVQHDEKPITQGFTDSQVEEITINAIRRASVPNNNFKDDDTN